ncbi:Elongin-A [Arthrobotrys entomopaga]|nr:Elongin-A [Arthrobotrys entomopaga]
MFQQAGDPFPTLFELAKRACIRNVDAIDDVGDLPYSIVRPILQKLESPAKLDIIQTNCPQIAEDSAELWQAFIYRDFGPEALETYKPKDPQLWNRVYRKLKKEKDVKDRKDIDMLKAAMKVMNDQRQKRQVGLCGVRKQDVQQLRSLDRGPSIGGGGWGRGGSGWSRTASTGPFKNRTLNKVLLKGRRR